MTGGRLSEDELDAIVEAAWERLERGEAVEEEAIVRAHPDFSDDLRRRFEALRRVHLAFVAQTAAAGGGTARRRGHATGEPGTAPSLAGTSLGPYRLDSALGAGGMGTVYLATVTRRVSGLVPGERVAVKVVHPHLLSREGFFKRFLREAEIGRRLRHDNVVRTLDADAVESAGAWTHFLAMEYVEGQTLRSLLAEVGRLPEELCRHVGREVAQALTAIHDAGAVHRDLKPDNVLITTANVVKVMDLGVARMGDDPLGVSQTGAFVGSVRYAAPEQFRGGAATLDGRADLYALGLLLYELSTGRHPFSGDDFHVVLRQQMTEVPRAPGEINPQLSPFFEEVLKKLLAKERDARFASAADLLTVLVEGEKSRWWQERAVEVRATTRRPLRRVRIPRETALHGRDDDLAKLRALHDQAKAGDGRVVLVEGEAGIGKSRLVDEFVGRLESAGEEVNFLHGSYPPGGAATVSGAFSTAYREQFGEAALEETLKSYLTITPLLVPAFAALLRGDAAPTGVEPLTKDSLQTVFVHATRALAAERTTIVLIEDLHFAPEEGRALFTSLALAVPGHRILLVGTTRPGLPAAWLTSLDRMTHASRLPLARLGPKDLSRLLVDAFRSERLAEELAFRIGAKSDGNPYFVFELIRGLREGQFIRQQPDGTWVTTQVIRDIQIPSTVRDLVGARLADLADEDKDLLDVASCIGFEFDARIVAAALGVPAVQVLKRLARVEAKHRLVRSAGERFVFDHHQVQETLYAALPPLLAMEHHAAIGTAIETTTGAAAKDPKDIDGAACVDICEHFLKGGQGERALRYLNVAITHCNVHYRNDVALSLSGRALETPGLVGGDARAELIVRRSEIFDLLGMSEAERAELEEAATASSRSADPGLRCRVSLRLGWHHISAAQYDRASEHLQRALELARAAGDAGSEARAVCGLGSVANATGNSKTALELRQRHLELTRAQGNRRGEAAALANLGNTLLDTGDAAAAVEMQLQVLAMARESGDRHQEAIATSNLGLAVSTLGRTEEARERHLRAGELAREVGDRRLEAMSCGNVGVSLWSSGQFEAARECYERFLGLACESGDRRSEAIATGNLGTACFALGRLSDAIAYNRRYIDLAHAIGFKRGVAIGHANLGVSLRSLGCIRLARETFERYLELARGVDDRLSEAYALQFLGDVTADQGDAPGAERLYRAALDLRRAVRQRDGEADSLRSLGVVLVRSGRPSDARESLDAALGIAREVQAGGVELLATAWLARLDAVCVPAALAALELLERGVSRMEAMEARLLVWQVTRDPAHLVEAKRVLEFMLEHAPPEYRASMLTNVRVHREIVAACREQGMWPD